MSLAPEPRLLAHRFFYALKPDDVTARRTHAFAERELGPKGLLRPDRHHVTLGLTEDVPDVPRGLVDALLRAGDAVAAAPFELALDRLAGSHRSVALRPARVVPALRALQAAIARAMASGGIALRAGWSFSPHQTLAYRRGAIFTRRVPPFRWQVTEFVLVHSHVGLHRHETIGRWPLAGAPDAQGSLF